jgi:hypothetical protein
MWQNLGFNPWKRPREGRKKESKDFYKGAFDSIPFLNDDAKRTFVHLLLRPGYMIRDYIRGRHEIYLAPLTALIVFYAFFALISSVLQPIQQKKSETTLDEIVQSNTKVEPQSEGAKLVQNTLSIARKGYVLLHLDQYPEEVDTQREASLAAFESALRSQGIPLFIGEFFLLWLAMGVALRRYRMGMSACAAAAAYVLCQFSFFMLFVVLLTLGEKSSISFSLMFLLLLIDYRQWLGVSWKKSLRLTISTGINFFVFYGLILLLISLLAVLLAFLKG